MALSVNEFMNMQNKSGKQSRLEPFKDEILLLKSNGYTLEKIMDFLSQNEIRISKTALHHFIKTRMKLDKQLSPLISKTPKSEPKEEERDAVNDQSRGSKSGKFNWQSEVKDSDIFWKRKTAEPFIFHNETDNCTPLEYHFLPNKPADARDHVGRQ